MLKRLLDLYGDIKTLCQSLISFDLTNQFFIRKEWNRKMMEYRQMEKEHSTRLEVLKLASIGKHEPLSFQPGVVASFMGVHPETNCKVLRVSPKVTT